MHILISGGCGFVGSSLAKLFAKDNHSVTVIDNLKRKGSELNLAFFKKLNIEFIHCDIRNANDLNSIDKCFDLVIDAAAEPSVLSGALDSKYVIDTNLYGTINILDFSIKKSASMIFLSTSRVYSIESLMSIPLIEKQTRFDIDHSNRLPKGLSINGISEKFKIFEGYRSLYGVTKLSSELIIKEYSKLFNFPTLINRCGVLSGSGQFGKTDQGVFSMFVAKYLLNQNIIFKGFGGSGKQVRDILHPDDLYSLIIKQCEHKKWNSEIYCIGGGIKNSTSLLEYIKICENITQNSIPINRNNDTSNVDIPYYVTDYSRAYSEFNWEPKISIKEIIEDIYIWLKNNPELLEYIFN